MAYQLWTRDEYGQGSIIASSDTIDTLVDLAKKEVSTKNVDNALTADQKALNWEFYFVELLDSESGEEIDHTSGVYSGLDNQGKHAVLLVDDKRMVKMSEVDADVRIYLGNLDKIDWFAKDERGRLINDFNHRDLQGKTVYFIRETR